MTKETTGAGLAGNSEAYRGSDVGGFVASGTLSNDQPSLEKEIEPRI